MENDTGIYIIEDNGRKFFYKNLKDIGDESKGIEVVNKQYLDMMSEKTKKIEELLQSKILMKLINLLE